MGVRGLVPYLRKNKFNQIKSLKELVDQHRSESLPRPLVIIDGRSVCSVTFGKSPTLLYDFAEVHRSLSALHSLLTSLNVEVVVYFAGTATDRDYYMNWQMMTAKRVITSINNWHNYDTLNDIDVMPIRSYRDLVRFTFGLYFKVIGSATDCETDLVHYARQRQCLAVIGQNTNFLIYNARLFYWPYLNINFFSKTVEMYDMKRFTNYMNINFEHLPFLACVLGNSSISIEKTCEYFQCSLGVREKISIATRVLARFRHLTLQELRESPHFETVLNGIFPRAKDKEALYRDFSKNIAKYIHYMYTNELKELDDVHEYVKLLVSSNKIQSSFYFLLSNKNFFDYIGFQQSRNGLNHFRENVVYADLRKRLYYLMFRDESCEIEEYRIKYNMEEIAVQVEVEVAKPIKFELAVNMGLLELWKNKEKKIEDLKWKLFVNSISVNSDIDIDKFRVLPAKYYGPVLILHYLLYHPTIEVLEKWEADVFLSHLSLKGKVPEAEECNLRAVELINIYNNGLVYICHLVAASGFPISIETLMECNGKEWHFDGQAFYNLYCYIGRGGRNIITDDLSTEPRRLLGLV